MLDCSNARMLKCSNAQMRKCSNILCLLCFALHLSVCLSVRRGISDEDKQKLKDLQAKYLKIATNSTSSNGKGESDRVAKSKQAWKQARAAKYVWKDGVTFNNNNNNNNNSEKQKKAKMEIKSFAAEGIDEDEYQRMVARNKRQQKANAQSGSVADDDHASLLRKFSAAGGIGWVL